MSAVSSHGTLFSVAMPIGNVKDISIRAKETIESSDFLACEDTRKAGRILKMMGIDQYPTLLSYHSYNEKNSAKGLLKLLMEGKSIALITDAGSPRISDPGHEIIKQCWNHQIKVVPIPGSSAISSFLSICPFRIEPLLFLGFLSPKSGRRIKTLKEYNNFVGSVCLFESVHRIKKFLIDLFDTWGEQMILIGRELTKKHEEIFLGTILEALHWSEGKKGEFIFLVKKEINLTSQ